MSLQITSATPTPQAIFSSTPSRSIINSARREALQLNFEIASPRSAIPASPSLRQSPAGQRPGFFAGRMQKMLTVR